MIDKVNFGFLKVSKKTKDKMVSNLFTSVSEKYDLMNDVMSLGLHRVWKKKMINMCNPESIHKVIDIASGTGDIPLQLLKRNRDLLITCLDSNQEMHQICKNKMFDNGFTEDIEYICSSIEKCTLKDNTFDLATIAFGFRNFTDYQTSLKNIYRILKPGGKIVILELCNPPNKYINNFFEKYTFDIIPQLGKLVADDYDSYKYLAESIRMHPNPEKVLEMLNTNQFINTKYIYLTSGIVTIHIGFKS
ncbi:MAG: ubiquinone/menaquinone biosynthesis methyltransferase [Pseudomonadota bacterium]|nr:ubiquinone/menaquinone biosynthesis methyltransferase [Pseudomonadota bacterium]